MSHPPAEHLRDRARVHYGIILTMKFIRTIALLALSLAVVRCEAASVEWDNFTHVETEFDVQADSGKSDNSIRIGNLNVTLGLKYYLTVCDGYDPPFWSISIEGNHDTKPLTAVREVTPGETITVDSLDMDSERGHHFFYHLTPGETTDAYFALLSTNMDGTDPTIAWIAITGTTDPHIVVNHTAISDGEPLLVGAIPEPTSGLLLLVGSALLLTRRRC